MGSLVKVGSPVEVGSLVEVDIPVAVGSPVEVGNPGWDLAACRGHSLVDILKKSNILMVIDNQTIRKITVTLLY